MRAFRPLSLRPALLPVLKLRPSCGNRLQHLSRGFEAVREAFADNFARRGELGGACCAYYRGENVVDLWGGIRNKETGQPWERDTMVLV